MIALKHKKKLQLIFGKWNHLKGILGVLMYYNFEIVLNREIRLDNRDSRSVRKGGNKEMIVGVREIISENRESMSDFANAGWKVLGKYMLMQLLPEASNQPDYNKTYWLREKFKAVLMLLNPLPSFSATDYIGMMGLTQGTRTILRDMEESFANEINAFYYINLHSDSNIRVREPRKNYDSIESLKPPDKNPKQWLSLLIEHDKEKPLIKKWIEDLRRQQSEVLKLLDNFKELLKTAEGDTED